jgi:hypothetical protein
MRTPSPPRHNAPHPCRWSSQSASKEAPPRVPTAERRGGQGECPCTCFLFSSLATGDVRLPLWAIIAPVPQIGFRVAPTAHTGWVWRTKWGDSVPAQPHMAHTEASALFLGASNTLLAFGGFGHERAL